MQSTISVATLQVKVWDIRALKPMHAYFTRTPATTLDISQRGLLAIGCGRKVQVLPGRPH